MSWYRMPLLASALLAVGLMSGNALAEDKPSEPRGIELRLVDEQGQPVSGALVGRVANWGDMHLVKTGWQYLSGDGLKRQETSDNEGRAHLHDEHESLTYFPIVARHVDRKLAAVALVEPKDAAAPITLVMHPECHVAGSTTCIQLARIPSGQPQVGFELGTGVTVYQRKKLIAEFWSKDPAFELFLPPGDYTLEVRDAKSWTHRVTKSISISTEQANLTVDPIDRPVTQLKLLEGQPAPEIPDVLASTHGAGVSLKNLRGRVVLLEFWGYWCGPCVRRMPDLFELHEKHRDRGLSIVGVHVDLGDDETEPVDTVDRLNARLVDTRRRIWKGRDLPFPTLLVSGKRTTYGEGIEGQPRGTAVAAYGVQSFPTQVLIDRQGRVDRQFYPSPENLARLEQLLADE